MPTPAPVASRADDAVPSSPHPTNTQPAERRMASSGNNDRSGVTMEGFVYLYVFMLAAFTGYEVISRVPVILHTPLMSGSNFVHGVVLVGGMVVLGQADPDSPLQLAIGFIAVLLGAANAAGGYVVTERMLAMFKGGKKEGIK